MSAHSHSSQPDNLSDFRTNRRVLWLVGFAVPIGVMSAFLAKGLLWLIAIITNLVFFQTLSTDAPVLSEHHLGAWVIAMPVLGGLVIGLMARFGSEKIRGHGIPEALEAILLGKSVIHPKVAVLKPVSSAISIGTGGPFGAEGPIIMTGGAFGSLFAQLFHLSAAERKTLLVAGAAAGMAAVFGTPIAAVLLSVELLLFEWKPRSFVPVAVAAVVGSLVRVPLLGHGPIFPITLHPEQPAAALGTALLLGLCAGICSGALTWIVYACEDFFGALRIHWMWWPALGGLIVGVGGYFDPRVLGVGYETIHGLMRGDILGAALLSLLVVKTLVWAVALGSGTSGGVLAPLLIIGGGLGALLGNWIPGADASLCAMIGMAAMMGGTMRAPLTAILFVLELTNDLAALPALLVGTVAAVCVTVLMMRRSILTEKLARRGQHISREYSVDVFELVRVGDVMSREVPIVPHTLSVGDLSDRISSGDQVLAGRHGTVIVDEHGRLAGILTRDDIVRALVEDPEGKQTVLEAGQRDAAVTFADESLHDALTTMLERDVGRLPVVARADAMRIEGYLGRAEILRARSRHHEEEVHRSRGPFMKWAR